MSPSRPLRRALAAASLTALVAVLPSHAGAASSASAIFTGSTGVVDAGDFNGDGIDDMVDSGNPVTDVPLSVILGSRPVTSLSTTSGVGVRGLELRPVGGYLKSWVRGVGDLDDDGFDDVAVTLVNSEPLPNVAVNGQTFIVYGAAGNAPVTLAPGPRVGVITTGNWAAARPAGDFNGDGKDDLVVGRSLGAAASWSTNTFRAGASVILGGPRITTLNANSASSRTVVITAQSNGCTFNIALGFVCPAAFGAYSGAGDFNGDGKDDLYFDTGRVDGRRVLLGSASTAPIAVQSAGDRLIRFAATSTRTAYAQIGTPAGDVNGDGKDDLLMQRQTPDGVDQAAELYLGRAVAGGSLVTGPSTSLTGPEPSRLMVYGVGDTNRDGRDDLAVASRVTGTNDGYVKVLTSGLSGTAGATYDVSPVPNVTGLPGLNWRYLSLYDAPPLQINALGDPNGDGYGDFGLTDAWIGRTFFISGAAGGSTPPPTTPPATTPRATTPPVTTPPATTPSVTTPPPATGGVAPPIQDGRWLTLGGAVTYAPNDRTILTPAAPDQRGAIAWPVAVNPNGTTIRFATLFSGGNGAAEGLALSFVPAGPGGAQPAGGLLGSGGGALGIGGLGATTLALDVFQGPTDPAANFVGLATTSTQTSLGYLQTADAGVRLRGNPVQVQLTSSGGVVTVSVNGKLRLTRTMTLPASAFVVLSASTGSGVYESHAVNGFSMTRP